MTIYWYGDGVSDGDRRLIPQAAAGAAGRCAGEHVTTFTRKGQYRLTFLVSIKKKFGLAEDILPVSLVNR